MLPFSFLNSKSGALWDSMLVLIYRIAAHDLENGNAHVGEQCKQLMVLRMNPALPAIDLMDNWDLKGVLHLLP